MSDRFLLDVPPDPPPEEGRADDRRKKKKVEEMSLAICDVPMKEKIEKEKMEDINLSKDKLQEESMETEENPQPPKFPSYRASLMGFNGVANSRSTLEEDEDILKDDEEFTWKIPEPSEEIMKLMEVYPTIPVSQDEYNEWCGPWNHSLIITILGRRFNLFWLKEHFRKVWGFSSFELIDLPNNYFIVRLLDEQLWRCHYRKILWEGPWTVRNHCVLVQRWSPYFNPYSNPLGRIATWVRVPDIPIHCYNRHFISRLGDRIGKTLKVDMNTLTDFHSRNSRVERGKFARICVELDLQKPLVPKVIFADAIFNVEYEGLGKICFACGRFGHRREACPWKPSSSSPFAHHENSDSPIPSRQEQPPEKAPQVKVVSGEKFGDWMITSRTKNHLVCRQFEQKTEQRGRQESDRSTRKPPSFGQKSRFAVFEDMENEESENVNMDTIEIEGPVKSDNFGKAIVVVEKRKGDMSRVGTDNGQRRKLGLSEKVKPKVVYKAVGKENQGPKIGPDPIGPPEAPNQLGSNRRQLDVDQTRENKATKGSKRTHLVVQGNLKALDYNPIGALEPSCQRANPRDMEALGFQALKPPDPPEPDSDDEFASLESQGTIVGETQGSSFPEKDDDHLIR